MSNTYNRALPRTLRAGSLAYLDTLRGLVPCKVSRVYRDPDHAWMLADVTVTASRGAYKRGERITGTLAKYLPPRDAITRRNGCSMVQRFTCIEG